MKRFTSLFALVLVCGLLVAGCDKPKDPKDPAGTTPTGTTPPLDPKLPAPVEPNPVDTAKQQIDTLRGQLEDLLTKRGSISKTVETLQGILGGLGKIDLLKDQIGALQTKIPALDNKYLNVIKETGLLKGMDTNSLASLPAIKSLLDGNADLSNMLKSLSGLQSQLDAAKSSDNIAEKLAATLIEKQVVAEQAKVTTTRNAIVADASKDLITKQATEAATAKTEADAAKAQLAKLETTQAKATTTQAELDTAQAKLSAQNKAIAELEAKLAELEK